MLNSAAGVVLPPSKNPPPMSTSSLIFGTISGARWMAVPTLVWGPSVHTVTESSFASRSVSISQSTACSALGDRAGSGSSTPSMPVLPCTCSAVTSGRTMGRAQPAKTGTSSRPASSHIFRAFFVVRSRGTLPATVVMPSTSSSRDARANRMAMASSWPGSVSMMIGRLIPIPPAPRPGSARIPGRPAG